MTLQEAVARKVCERRGVDPDLPVTIVLPEGGQEAYDPAWQGYVSYADELIDLIQNFGG